MNGFIGAVALVTVGVAAISLKGRSVTHMSDGASAKAVVLTSAQLDTTFTQALSLIHI